MTRAFERRAQRVLGIANDRLAQSKWVIWCHEPEHMPAMIDLLIAQGVLSESDRPHCLHWKAVSGLHETKVLDADAMLEEAGIATLSGEQWKAAMQGRERLEALWREWFGELSADDLQQLAELESNVRQWGLRECRTSRSSAGMPPGSFPR